MLHQAASFALRSNDAAFGHDVDDLAAELRLGNRNGRSVIQSAGTAEESLRRFFGFSGLSFAMYQLRYFKSQHFLGFVDGLILKRS